MSRDFPGALPCANCLFSGALLRILPFRAVHWIVDKLFNRPQFCWPGDYNHDGIVDVADYTVWRDTLGSTTNLAADGDGNHVVDAADHNLWKSNFGNHSGSGAGANAGVPEPSMFVLLLAGIPTLCCRRRAMVS
jgi:hypothetical protein